MQCTLSHGVRILLDFLAVQFAKDGYDLRKFLKFVLTSEAYGSESDRLEFLPGEEYVYKGPVPKRMTAEQLMDTIWQVTGTNPNQAEAKVDRSPKISPFQTPKKKIYPRSERLPPNGFGHRIHRPGKSNYEPRLTLKTNPYFPLCLRPVTMHSVFR